MVRFYIKVNHIPAPPSSGWRRMDNSFTPNSGGGTFRPKPCAVCFGSRRSWQERIRPNSKLDFWTERGLKTMDLKAPLGRPKQKATVCLLGFCRCPLVTSNKHPDLCRLWKRIRAGPFRRSIYTGTIRYLEPESDLYFGPPSTQNMAKLPIKTGVNWVSGLYSFILAQIQLYKIRHLFPRPKNRHGLFRGVLDFRPPLSLCSLQRENRARCWACLRSRPSASSWRTSRERRPRSRVGKGGAEKSGRKPGMEGLEESWVLREFKRAILRSKWIIILI